MKKVTVGIVDSGYGFRQSPPMGTERVVSSKAFRYGDNGVEQGLVTEDSLGHGSAILEIVAGQAPQAEFVIAQIFTERLTTTAVQVAAAIDWLVEQKVDVINMSLGLRSDRDALRYACEKAVAAGIIVCASTPARGDPVYPASYPGVFRMTGDARCSKPQISCLKTQYADFGGYVQGRNGVVGASAGCAQMSGHIARYLTEGGDSDPAAVNDWLQQQAEFFGAEVRFPISEPDGVQTDGKQNSGDQNG
ncbi:subtilisin-like serine protease QhpE [Amphritea sp. HPY]|uniref:subtilisin-like serine protease QhpE n=1 Tax=Amphritea sp. HPY TaxID=3421652 RepID=UPI003D7CB50F